MKKATLPSFRLSPDTARDVYHLLRATPGVKLISRRAGWSAHRATTVYAEPDVLEALAPQLEERGATQDAHDARAAAAEGRSLLASLAARIAEPVTTCQICGRAILAKTGLIAHHGYQRPDGRGYQTASCPGARELPYEVSRDFIPTVRDGLLRHAEGDEQAAEGSARPIGREAPIGLPVPIWPGLPYRRGSP